MGGKAAMLLVLGFSLIFLVFGSNFNSLSTRSVDNNTDITFAILLTILLLQVQI